MIVNLVDYTPPARFDGLPFTQARVEEAPAPVDSVYTWTPVETFTLSPVDPDPAHPRSRNFTTELATEPDGYYRVVFVDATGDESLPSAAIQYHIGIRAEIRPTVHELSTLMRARLKTEFGSATQFGADTIPTADQADDLIDVATDIVLTKLGLTFAESYYKLSSRAILFKAAALVEITYYPEQANDDASAYSLYEDQYNQLIATLITAIEGGGTTGAQRFGSIPITGRDGHVVTDDYWQTYYEDYGLWYP